MEFLIDRIAHVAELEGISIAEMERRIGAGKGVRSRAIKNHKDIYAKLLANIVNAFPQYSPMWILTGAGDINSPYKNNADFLDIIRLIDIIEKQQETILRQMKVIENYRINK